MTPAKQKRATPERPVLMRVLYSSKTSLVLGIFAFLSIVYYKARIAPPDDDPKTVKKTPSPGPEDRPLLSLGVLGKAREDGPVLTRSFFATGDILLGGSAKNPQWGLVIVSKSAVDVVHPWYATQPVLPWIRQRGTRFALFRTLSPPATQQRLSLLLSPWYRPQALSSVQQQTLQQSWRQQLQSLPTSWPTVHTSSPSTKKPEAAVKHVSPVTPQPLPTTISDVYWIFLMYQNTGISHLPSVAWEDPQATVHWLQRLLQQSHYSDLLP